MGFICGVLLMYMGEDDVLPPCDPSINSYEQLPTMGHGPGVSDVDLVAGELLHGWTIYARPLGIVSDYHRLSMHIQLRSCTIINTLV